MADPRHDISHRQFLLQTSKETSFDALYQLSKYYCHSFSELWKEGGGGGGEQNLPGPV